ncbi:MAG: V-type ATPase subunit, partial [Anaerolineaceae bacterium]|nr:V-type ATPase subunit [Anaerolineaceae bacterium]
MALYDYGNTRLRVKISELFSLQKLMSFADLNSLGSFISQLSKSHYKNAIEISITHAHGYERISEALRRELFGIRTTLKQFYEPPLWEKIRTIFLRVDLQNIKTIVRGISHKVRTDLIINSLSPLSTIP